MRAAGHPVPGRGSAPIRRSALPGITGGNPQFRTCCSSALSAKSARSRPTSTWTSEHDRREEVIQYIYGKYGATAPPLPPWSPPAAPAACCATRARPWACTGGRCLAKEHHWFDEDLAPQAAGPGRIIGPAWLDAARPPACGWNRRASCIGFPRHPSQHVGRLRAHAGAAVAAGAGENAAMADRSIIQWDKDDLDDMGLMKVDVLALGAQRHPPLPGAGAPRCGVSAGAWPTSPPKTRHLRHDLRRRHRGRVPDRKPRPDEHAAAPAAALFTTWWWKSPSCGPAPSRAAWCILFAGARAARRGEALVEWNPTLEGTGAHAGRAHFQEQVMQIAMIAAKFSAAEADACAAPWLPWKRTGGVHKFEKRLIDGMVANGYAAELPRPSLRRCWLWRIRLSRKPCLQLCAAGLQQQLAQAPRARRFLALLNSPCPWALQRLATWCKTPAATACEVPD